MQPGVLSALAKLEHAVDMTKLLEAQSNAAQFEVLVPKKLRLDDAGLMPCHPPTWKPPLSKHKQERTICGPCLVRLTRM
jgi:hypothetical protein